MLNVLSLVKPLKRLPKIGLNVIEENFLSSTQLNVTPCRTTFILKRKYPVPLVKKTVDTNTFDLRKTRQKIYELVRYTENEVEEQFSVVLNTFVEGLGEKGDVVTLKRSLAYEKLLLPGLATYATPEVIEKFEANKELSKQDSPERKFSGIDVPRTLNILSSLIVSITMNKDNEWVIEPWHVKSAFRKAGVHLNEDCLELPNQKIKGPDINLEGKVFLVTVTINKREKVKVRCKIHHWSTDIIYRLPHTPLHWTLPAEPLFKEDEEILASMRLPPIPKPKKTD